MQKVQERHNEIEAEAIRWLVRLDARTAPDLLSDHQRWLSSSARHHVAYTKQSLLWKRMDLLRRLRPLDRGPADPDLLRPKRRWLGLQWSVMAFSRQESREPLSGLLPKAVIAGCVLGAVGLIARATIAPSAGATYVTAVGGTQQISLSDGSVLDVNTDSKVRVRFTDGRRQIHLDRGELRLRVAHDPSRPLEVLAGGITTRAIGTVFTVRLHEDARVETLVTEGRVVVLREQKLLGIPVTATPLSRTLAAGEKVIVDGKSASVSRASQKEVQRKLMWTTGKIAFEGEVLADVVNELNRYTVRKLVIRDPKIARTSLGGGFDTANAEAYAAEISRYFGPQKLVLVPPEAQGRSGPGRATTR